MEFCEMGVLCTISRNETALSPDQEACLKSQAAEGVEGKPGPRPLPRHAAIRMHFGCWLR